MGSGLEMFIGFIDGVGMNFTVKTAPNLKFRG
jgi:hypothetical protein